MQASELRRVVELPAGRVGLRVEPELADALVDDVEGEPGALPLLSTALLELWQKRQDNELTLACLPRVRRRSRRRRAAGREHVRPRPRRTQAARARDHAAPCRRGRRRRIGAPPRSARRARPGAQRRRGGRARDAGRQPPRHRVGGNRRGRPRGAAARMATPARVDRGGRRRASASPSHHPGGAEWDAAGRDQGELYRGARLAAALDWTADHALDLNELEREFVTESREASEKETQARQAHQPPPARPARRGRGLACSSRRGRDLRRRSSAVKPATAETAQLAQRLGAQALVEEDLDLSLLLARQAVADRRLAADPRLPACRRSCARPAAIGIMHGGGDHLRALAVSPDGKTLAVAGDGAGVRLFDARTYEQIGEPIVAPTGPGVPKEVRALRTAPTERRSRSPGFDVDTPGYLRLIDAQAREVLAEARRRCHRMWLSRRTDRCSSSRSTWRSAWIADHDPGRRDPEADRSPDPAGSVRRRVHRTWSTPHPSSRSRPTAARLSPRPPTVSSPGGIARAARRRGQSRLQQGSRPRDQPGRSHRGGRYRRAVCSSSTCAAGRCERTAERLAGIPNWVLFSPDGKTVVSTNLDGDRDSLGRRDGGTPRDAARALELRSAARLQPRRGDALHGESRRHRDRLGSDRRPPARATVHVHARSSVTIRIRRPPGEVQPRRPADRGRAQGEGDRALGRARL